MRQFLSEFKFILLFFILLSGATVFSYLESETATARVNPRLRLMYDQADPVAGKIGRSPAAVNPVSDALMLKKELLCQRLGPALSDRVTNRLVMINFKMCREVSGIQEVTLENQSNGFRAQIFRMEDRSFKTDYIQLNEGLNRLKFEVVLKDGQKHVESLEILSDSNSKQ